jgi:diguanylate cyclase (GGDEF)-like protein
LAGKSQPWWTFLIWLSVAVVVCSSVVFIALLLRTERLINREMLTRARTLFDHIVVTRRWNAGYGGVYVEKTAKVASNPYLRDPDLYSRDGKVYTKKNPALMTREISEIAGQEQLFAYHITSLKPLNPHNAPDAFEKTALESLGQRTREVFGMEQDQGRIFFRYLAPLLVEASCLQCHGEQGYQVGDVRGGISVRFDVSDNHQALRTNRYLLVLLGLSQVAALLILICFLTRRIKNKVTLVQNHLAQQAITDELTGLFNRRYFLQRLKEEAARAQRHHHPLSCLMIDLDHFKAVNDRYGHHTGDLVLQTVAHLIKSSSRVADVVARYGGEEFVVLLPETDAAGALEAAARLRELVAQQDFQGCCPETLHLTISVGVASRSPEDLLRPEASETLVQQADQALYLAKNRGRNRLELYQQEELT